MEYNAGKLHHELVKANIPIEGCSSIGRIDFKPEATQEQRDQAELIKQNHNPIWYIEERRKKYPPISDQIDVLYKIFAKLRLSGTDVGPEGDAWLDEIKKIKDDWPVE